jgi:hypothetical protein
MFVTSVRAPMGKARWTNLVRCDGTASPARASSLTASLRPMLRLACIRCTAVATSSSYTVVLMHQPYRISIRGRGWRPPGA